MTNKIWALIIIAANLFLLAGCANTAEGMNQDIKRNTQELRNTINNN